MPTMLSSQLLLLSIPSDEFVIRESSISSLQHISIVSFAAFRFPTSDAALFPINNPPGLRRRDANGTGDDDEMLIFECALSILTSQIRRVQRHGDHERDGAIRVFGWFWILRGSRTFIVA